MNFSISNIVVEKSNITNKNKTRQSIDYSWYLAVSLGMIQTEKDKNIIG